MNYDYLQDLLSKRPFEPFAVHLSSGETHAVRYPGCAALTRTRLVITDPNADPMGDGWSNLQKFLLGANPNQDNRVPTLPGSELFVYADGTTGVRLHALREEPG